MSDLIRIQALEDAARDHSSSLFLQLQRVPTCQTKKKTQYTYKCEFFYLSLYI